MRPLMRTALLLGLALGLSACTIQFVVPGAIEPSEFDVALSNADPVQQFSLSSQSSRSFDVAVGPEYGSQVVIMTSSGRLRVEDSAGDHLASSTSETFFTDLELIPLSVRDDDASVRPAITVTGPGDFLCVGPCVSFDTSEIDSVVTVSVTNTESSSQVMSLYVVGAPYYDESFEPSNDVVGGRRSLPSSLNSSATGAIESLGDVDWYEVQVGGSYSITAQPAFGLSVEVFYDGPSDPEADDDLLVGGGEGNATVSLVAGDILRVSAEQSDEAATAAFSWYSINTPTSTP